MGVRAWDDGRRERYSVMGQIGVELQGDITPHESGQTSIGCLVTRKLGELTLGSKADDSRHAGAASRMRDACQQQMSIVKVVLSTTGFREEPFEMPELPEGKLSRAVLRGRERGNSLLLPDRPSSQSTTNLVQYPDSRTLNEAGGSIRTSLASFCAPPGAVSHYPSHGISNQ